MSSRRSRHLIVAPPPKKKTNKKADDWCLLGHRTLGPRQPQSMEASQQKHVCMQPRCHASRKPVVKIVLCAHECIPALFPVTMICVLKWRWATSHFIYGYFDRETDVRNWFVLLNITTTCIIAECSSPKFCCLQTNPGFKPPFLPGEFPRNASQIPFHW